jgi:hypothetical protein
VDDARRLVQDDVEHYKRRFTANETEGWRRLGGSGRFVASKPVWTTAELASRISVLATRVDAHSPVQKPSTHSLIDSEG